MTITLPSLGHLVDTGRRAARRFPLVLLAGVVTAAAGMYLINTDGDDKQAIRLMLAAGLGLPGGIEGLSFSPDRSTLTLINDNDCGVEGKETTVVRITISG